MGGGGTPGGFEGNLKGTQNSAAGLREPSAEVFLLRYFGFEMELKTYFSLARPGQSGDLTEIPGNDYPPTSRGTERKP